MQRLISNSEICQRCNSFGRINEVIQKKAKATGILTASVSIAKHSHILCSKTDVICVLECKIQDVAVLPNPFMVMAEKLLSA